MSTCEAPPFADRVAVLGWPDSLVRFQAHAPAPWSASTLRRLTELGFNAVQLNLAWGSRPHDEPLNLEDIVELSPDDAAKLPQVVALNCQPDGNARQRRRAMVHGRLALTRQAGLRSLFHFGAPYNAHVKYGDGPPNCLLDPRVHARYRLLIEAFARDFPGVDDLLVYTYDQDAWLCSEFGPCPRCLGVPLHERLPPFLDMIRQTWRTINPSGRVWWEPWELSAGQVYACVERLCAQGFGLSLHANIAEAMSSVVTDRWLENTVDLAVQRGLPVWVEWFLGGRSEETEPLANLAYPQTVWRGLRKIAMLPGVTGLKEYYGLLPDRRDPNLAATALFLAEPTLSEDQAVRRLAEAYGPAAQAVAAYWRLASSGMEFYPWDCSWRGRQIGRAATDHSLNTAILRPMLCPTPSWQSTRGTVFMRTEDTAAHPWMLEDVALRCRQAANRWTAAEQQGNEALAQLTGAVAEEVRASMADLARLRRRATAYWCHLRASMLVISLRKALELGITLPVGAVKELGQVLRESRANHAAECAANNAEDRWAEMDQAIADLESGAVSFLQRWFVDAPDRYSRGDFSMTSA